LPRLILSSLGVWGRFEEIDFGFMPNQFVLKCTHDSSRIVIIDDKSKLGYEAICCFHGEPKFTLVCSERFSENGLKEDMYDLK